MGANISYLVLEDKQIEKLQNCSDYEEVLNNEILLFHEYKSTPFWKKNIEFGQLVKAWNPMLELLIRIDNTNEGILKTHLTKIIYLDYDIKMIIDKDTVTQVWSELKKISVSMIEDVLRDEELKSSIKESNGYRMNMIDCSEMIIIEFIELFQAFFYANLNKQKILITKA